MLYVFKYTSEVSPNVLTERVGVTTADNMREARSNIALVASEHEEKLQRIDFCEEAGALTTIVIENANFFGV